MPNSAPTLSNLNGDGVTFDAGGPPVRLDAFANAAISDPDPFGFEVRRVGTGFTGAPLFAAEVPALRYELGQRLKRFEAAWEKHEGAEPRKRALGHVEKLTQQFFAFRFGEAARGLDRAAFALLTEDEPAASRQWAWSLYAVPETRVVDGSAKELTVTVKQLYTVKGDKPKGLEVQLWFTDKQVTILKPDKFPLVVKVPLPPLGDFKGLDRKLYFMVEAGKELRHTALGISQVADLKARVKALKLALTCCQDSVVLEHLV